MIADYLRAWARHGIRFSIHARLRTAACVDIDATTGLTIQSGEESGIPLMAAVTGGPLAYRFPFSHPHAQQRGERNARFLDAAMLCEEMLPRLNPAIHDVLLCLAPVYGTEELSFETFLIRLDRFLAGLPRTHRFVVGLGNPEYLLPDYFACLREHGAAHLFHDAGMPPLLDQVMTPGVLTADMAVYRAAPGAAGYDAADRQLGILELIRRCLDDKKSCSLFLDGAADIAFMDVLMAMLNADLAKLSPIKHQAA